MTQNIVIYLSLLLELFIIFLSLPSDRTDRLNPELSRFRLNLKVFCKVVITLPYKIKKSSEAIILEVINAIFAIA